MNTLKSRFRPLNVVAFAAVVACTALAGCAQMQPAEGSRAAEAATPLMAVATATSEASEQLQKAQDRMRARIVQPGSPTAASQPASAAKGLAPAIAPISPISPISPELSTLTPPAPVAPFAPKPVVPEDPLTLKPISISVQNVHVGPLLWILVREFGLSLSVEPAVLELPQVTSLHLQKVTGRQALNHILAAFDIVGTVGADNVLTVSLMQEKTFDIEMLVGKSTFEVSAGGDVFGAGAKGGSGLKDNLSLTGEYGEKSDLQEGFMKSVEAILTEGTGANKDAVDKPRFTLDRSGAQLYVRARPSKVRSVEKLIDQGKAHRKHQVQIDAQLIDVQLKDNNQLGIDWTVLSNRVIGRLGSAVSTIPGITQALADGSNLNARSLTIPAQTIGTASAAGGGIGIRTDAFSAAINALRDLGTVKVLSNPTLRLRNGIPAYITVGNSVRYVQKVTSTTTNTGTGMSTTVDVQTDSLFSGLTMGVSAAVKADGFIELFIKPSQTQVQESSLALLEMGGGSKVTLPVINTKSMATTLNIRDGDTVLIGGLIDQQLGSSDQGVPGLSDVPGIGKLFNNTSKTESTRELVMVLRVKLL